MHKNKTKRLYRQAGISYVELLVVIVIIAIVASLALMQRGNANEQLQRQNVARELKVALERARFDSVKRRGEDGSANGLPDLRAKVLVNTNSFQLTTYRDDVNGVAAAELQNYALPPGTSIQRFDGGVMPVEVFFNRRGEATAFAGGSAVNPAFLSCNGPCLTQTPANSNIVLVTPTGTVNLLPGGTAIPSFAAPSVTTVAPGTGVNPDVILP
jgi:Tfp pilus assembly protein FimT